MKTYLEQVYREGDSSCWPVMTYDEDLDIDDRQMTRIGTFSVRDGVAPIDVITAINAHFEID